MPIGTRERNPEVAIALSLSTHPGEEPQHPAEQHSLWLSALLHLFPGACLAAFVVAATPVLESWGLDPLFALLFGIGVVIAPLELGYLTIHARRTTGSWSPLKAVDYGVPLPLRRTLRLAALPALFMAFLVGVSIAVIDQPLARSAFGWLPEVLRDMAVIDSETGLSAVGIALLLAAFVIFNGILGPVAEELYFRGHLLPRIDRFGWVAPLIGTVLFTLYHFHTPWRYPTILLGFLPMAWLAWRTRSFRVSLAAHMLVNNLLILMMLASFLSGQS